MIDFEKSYKILMDPLTFKVFLRELSYSEFTGLVKRDVSPDELQLITKSEFINLLGKWGYSEPCCNGYIKQENIKFIGEDDDEENGKVR